MKFLAAFATPDAQDTVASRAGDVATYGGAATAWGLFVANAETIAILVSTGVAVAGFLLHCWATIRRDRRHAEAHRLVMEKAKNADAQAD